MKWITRLLLRRFKAPEKFLSFAIRMYILIWKGVYMPEAICKTDHSKVTGRYCQECGDEINDPTDDRIKTMIKDSVTQALTEAGIIKPKDEPAPKKKTRSIAETFGGKKKD